MPAECGAKVDRLMTELRDVRADAAKEAEHWAGRVAAAEADAAAARGGLADLRARAARRAAAADEAARYIFSYPDLEVT